MNRAERRALARGGRLLGQAPTAIGDRPNDTGQNRCFVCHRLHLRRPMEPAWVATNTIARRQGAVCQRHKDELSELDQIGTGTTVYRPIAPGELVEELGIEVP